MVEAGMYGLIDAKKEKTGRWKNNWNKISLKAKLQMSLRQGEMQRQNGQRLEKQMSEKERQVAQRRQRRHVGQRQETEMRHDERVVAKRWQEESGLVVEGIGQVRKI